MAKAVERINLTLPPGRLVFSNFYEPKTHDHLGNRLKYKNGDLAGQDRDEYGGLIAIPKTRQNWWEEVSPDPNVGAWGQAIVNKANQDFPGGHAQNPNFSWKISDGDSTIPNSKNKRNCDNPYYVGHWLINITSDKPLVLCNRDGSARLIEKDAIKPGYWVQASINVCGNGELMKPGLYVGVNAVALNRIDEVINVGVNPATLGFGGSVAPRGEDVPAGYGQAMPTSAAAVPATPGTAAPVTPVPAATGVPSTPAVPNVASAVPATPVAAAVPATPVAAVPNTAFVRQAVTPPAQVSPPPVPAPVVATPQLVPTAKMPTGQTLDAFREAGWNDDLLIQHGYAVRQ